VVDCQRRKKVIPFPEGGTNENKKKVHVRIIESRVLIQNLKRWETV
jgi:hypothetical protein